MFNIIFPSLPNQPTTLAPFYEKEAKAAKEVGFNISIVSDANSTGPISIANGNFDLSLYRGWIVSPTYYHEFVHSTRNPLVDHQDYLWAHDFPNWYAALSNDTPHSLCYYSEEVRRLGVSKIAEEVAQKTGKKPLMIKDWLKSCKEKWEDACFIADASDVKEIERVVNNFFLIRGREFRGGLVFRDFLSLKPAGMHPKVAMPLPVEFRTFFLYQEPIFTTPYWISDVKYPDNFEFPPQEWLEEIGTKLSNPFVALDIAQDVNGKWWVIEVNNGGSAGLPEHIDLKDFYSSIFGKLKAMKEMSNAS